MALFIFVCSTIISCLIGIYLIFDFQDHIYNHDVQFFNHKLAFLSCFIALFLANILRSAYLNLIVTVIITYSIAFILGKYVSKRIIILNTLFLFTIIIIEEITYSLVSILLGHYMINMRQTIVKSLILIIVSKSFIILLYKLLIERVLKKNYNYLKSTHIQILISTFVLSLICIINISMIAVDYPTLVSVISSLLVFITFFIVLLIVNNMESYTELSGEMTVKDALITQMKLNYKELFNKYKEDRKSIHDFQKHLAILGELQLNSPSDIPRYIEEVLVSLNKDITVKIEENSILPALFSTYTKKCKELNIKLTINSLNLENYSISSVDWVIILGNILDNAIENIDINNPEIIVDIKRNNNFLILSVSNTYNIIPVINNNSIKSIKKDKLKHGYGIENVKLIVKKYKGDYQLSINKNNMFDFNIIIPLSLIQQHCI